MASRRGARMLDNALDALRRVLASSAVRIAAALGMLAVLAGPTHPEAASHVLVMIEAPGCVYCARWHAEVGPGYNRSPEGRFAPLARRQSGDADIAFIRGVSYTPTFVLVRGDRELGRIVGYGGEDFFWGKLDEILKSAGFRPPQQPPLQEETSLGGRRLASVRTAAAP